MNYDIVCMSETRCDVDMDNTGNVMDKNGFTIAYKNRSASNTYKSGGVVATVKSSLNESWKVETLVAVRVNGRDVGLEKDLLIPRVTLSMVNLNSSLNLIFFFLTMIAFTLSRVTFTAIRNHPFL